MYSWPKSYWNVYFIKTTCDLLKTTEICLLMVLHAVCFIFLFVGLFLWYEIKSYSCFFWGGGVCFLNARWKNLFPKFYIPSCSSWSMGNHNLSFQFRLDILGRKKRRAICCGKNVSHIRGSFPDKMTPTSWMPVTMSTFTLLNLKSK